MNKKALSLVEVLVALVIVAIAASMFLYFADALRLTSVSKQETEATAFVKNYISGLQSRWQNISDYEYLDGLNALHNAPSSYKTQVTLTDAAGATIATCEAVPDSSSQSVQTDCSMSVPNGAAARNLLVTLTDSKDRSFQVATLIARPPNK